MAWLMVTYLPEIAERAGLPLEGEDFVLSTTVVRALRAACAFVTKRPLIADRARVPDRVLPRPLAMVEPPSTATLGCH